MDCLAILACCIGVRIPALCGSAVPGGDWPQILGPERNGKAVGEKAGRSWPAGGPKQLWTHKLGSGYAGPAVVGQRVIVFHRLGDSELVEAFDAASGKSQWKADIRGHLSRRRIDPDNGPRCVPLVAGERVYVFGAAGDLRCVSLDRAKSSGSGTVRRLRGRRRLLRRREHADSRRRQIAGECRRPRRGNRGPRSGHRQDRCGKPPTKGPATASPAAVKLGGKEQAALHHADELRAGRSGAAAGAQSAVSLRHARADGQRGHAAGALAASCLSPRATASVHSWRTLDAASQDRSGPTTTRSPASMPRRSSINGFLYGTHGREDIGVAELRCVEAATGKVRWRQPGYGVAHVILADDKLLIVGVRGRLALATANPAKYEELASHQLVRDVTRALPALAGGRLYVRTGSGKAGGQLHCLAVGQ